MGEYTTVSPIKRSCKLEVTFKPDHAHTYIHTYILLTAIKMKEVISNTYIHLPSSKSSTEESSSATLVHFNLFEGGRSRKYRIPAEQAIYKPVCMYVCM